MLFAVGAFRMHASAIIAIMMAFSSYAQSGAENAAPTLQFSGSPMRVVFDCNEEDSREAGLTCSPDEPCPVYLELSGIESALSRMFVIGNLHTAETTLFSILLASDDGGKTWAEPMPRIRFGALEQIQFIDFEYGWIGGAILQGVPRDPFFLITTDGGKTWDRRPIFDDARFGVVEAFWFDSRSSGTLLIDTKLRHEIYTTQTGGSDWTLQRSSASPIPFTKERRTSEGPVRLRPDPSVHAYRIEKKQGEKWVSAAEFAIRVGECKQ